MLRICLHGHKLVLNSKKNMDNLWPCTQTLLIAFCHYFMDRRDTTLIQRIRSKRCNLGSCLRPMGSCLCTLRSVCCKKTNSYIQKMKADIYGRKEKHTYF